MKSQSSRSCFARSLSTLSILAAWGLLASTGCDSAPLEPALTGDDAMMPVALECGDPGEVPGVETFLAATSAVQGVSGSVQADVREQLEALAQGLGLQTSTSSSLSELAAQVQAGMLGALGSDVQGLELVHEAASCILDTDAAGVVAAGCDPAIDPASALVQCLGTCVGLPGASLACDGDAVLHCESPAPELACSTDCVGTCATAITQAACPGACIGSCEGICTDLASDGSCNGTCIGLCDGLCGLVTSGGACDGTCMGDCVSIPAAPDCDDTAVPACVPGATGAVECSDLCEGLVAVPGLLDACVVPVESLANAATTCVPPPSQLQLTFAASTDDDTQAEMQLLADDVAASMSAMLASQAQAQTLLGSALSPVSGLLAVVDELIASVTAILGAPEGSCVVEQLQGATDVLTEAESGLEDAVRAVDILEQALGGISG